MTRTLNGGMTSIAGICAVVVALAAVVAMTATGTSINGVFNSISSRLNSSVAGS